MFHMANILPLMKTLFGSTERKICNKVHFDLLTRVILGRTWPMRKYAIYVAMADTGIAWPQITYRKVVSSNFVINECIQPIQIQASSLSDML